MHTNSGDGCCRPSRPGAQQRRTRRPRISPLQKPRLFLELHEPQVRLETRALDEKGAAVAAHPVQERRRDLADEP
jgi:hypothetical protein